MNLDSTWNYLYKIDYKDGTNCKTNLLYTPYLNSSGDVLCIDYSPNIDYQKNKVLSEELISYFFEKELKYLKLFQDKDWAPKILDIDNKRIYVEFNKESLNHILMSKKNLNAIIPDWQEQITNIILSIDHAGYYKLALYPHSFFISKDGKLKVLDFYTFLEKNNPFIPKSFIEGMIGKMSEHRFNEATVGDNIDFSIFFNKSLELHLKEYWGDINPFPEIYKKLITKN